MTTSSFEIQRKIDALTSLELQAADAERARIDAENEHLLVIASTREEIAQLTRAKRAARVAELKDENRALIDTWQREVNIVIAQLESPDLKLSDVTPNLLKKIGTAYSDQIENSQTLASLIQQSAYDATTASRAALMRDGMPERMAEMRVEGDVQKVIGNHMAGLQNAIHPFETLAMWINRAPNDVNRRQRVAIAFILTGTFNDPPRDFIPRSAMLMPRQYM